MSRVLRLRISRAPRERIRVRVARELRARGIPVNPRLPEVEGDPAQHLRRGRDVAARIGQLYALVAIGLGDAAPAEGRAWLERNGLFDTLEAREKEQFERELHEQERFDLSWLAEAVRTLAWSGGLVPRLDFPDHVGHFSGLLPRIPPQVSFAVFAASFKLRDMREILYQLDLYYCLHWALVDWGLNGRTPEEGDPIAGVVVERRRALEWVVSEESWSQVHMDT